MGIILELMDRQRVQGTLAHPFNPEGTEIELLIGVGRKKQTFPFQDICCALLKSQHQWAHLFDNPTFQEEVTTLNDKTYHVHVPDGQPYPTGFFAKTVGGKPHYSLIFFTKTGIKTRKRTEVPENEAEPEAIESLLPIQKIMDEHGWNVQLRASIGNILTTAGFVKPEDVQRVLEQQKQNKRKRIGEFLIEQGYISNDQLLTALAAKFRFQMIDLTKTEPEVKALEVLPIEVIHKLQIIPVMIKGEVLVIAASQPTDYSIYENLRFYTSRKIEIVITSSQQIAEAIEKYFPSTDPVLDNLIGDQNLDQDVSDESDEDDDDDETGVSESDSKIINFVNKFLIDAFNKGASDIHFEPGFREQPFKVRYRIDGICQPMYNIPAQYKKAIVSRLKIMAGLDITERRKPQSGKILLRFKKNRVEYRLEITPTTGYNEDAVLRVLPASKPVAIEKMGFSPTNERAFRAMLAQPYGIILCVGPTGSGKTTTLHSALGYLNTPERKIWTAEDPVEITQPGLRQVQVQSKIGLNFAEVLRSFLRADPDIIMIGEMRDREPAKTAIEASLTGHLVLSTLHTNSATETLVRLIEMDMDPYNFADALLGILAQRLTRRLCDNCKAPYHPSEKEFAALVHHYDPYWFEAHKLEPYSQKTLLMKKTGCDKCHNTGYRGRIAIHELIAGTSTVKTAIKKGTPVEEIKLLAIQDGMRTLLMDGVQKVMQGLTEMNNVLKVCSSQKVDFQEL